MAGTHGTADRIAEDFSKTEELVGFFTVNITDIIRRLRARAWGRRRSKWPILFSA
jgi:hypothetical protein